MCINDDAMKMADYLESSPIRYETEDIPPLLRGLAIENNFLKKIIYSFGISDKEIETRVNQNRQDTESKKE